MLLPPLSLSISPSSRICKRISKGAFQPGPNTPTGAGVLVRYRPCISNSPSCTATCWQSRTRLYQGNRR
ncbi:hypothetical protein DYP11_17760 [Escherichia coli]|nr:hypothetical protein [Escherichia coli]